MYLIFWFAISPILPDYADLEPYQMMDLVQPLTAGVAYIRVFIFLLAH